MKVKVRISMFQADTFEAIVDKEWFDQMLEQCDFDGQNFVTIFDMNWKREVKVNPKYVAYMEFTEVKE